MPEREFVQWVITKDHVGAGNDDGRIGPRDANLTRDEIIAHPTATKFRLYSDDNELYYEGVMTVPDDYASRQAWMECVSIASAMSIGTFTPNGVATHYHSGKAPRWAGSMRLVAVIGGHRFYREVANG